MAFYGVLGDTLTVPCGCVSAYETSVWHDHFITIFGNCASIAEDNEKAIAIYPNPTSGHITIETEGLQRIEVYNSLGQLVESRQSEGDVFECDLSGHKAGIYLIRMETASGIVTKQVMLTK